MQGKGAWEITWLKSTKALNCSILPDIKNKDHVPNAQNV